MAVAWALKVPSWHHFSTGTTLPERYRTAVILRGGRVQPTLLIDGGVAGIWRIERAGDDGRLLIEACEPLPSPLTECVLEEGTRLVRFVADDAAAFSARLVRNGW